MHYRNCEINIHHLLFFFYSEIPKRNTITVLSKLMKRKYKKVLRVTLLMSYSFYGT